MATTRSFQAMLNDYLPNKLLKEELVKRDWLLSNIEKDDGWLQGPLIVPFKSAGASSVSFGSLTASNDIAEDGYVRGEISTYPEVHGSMLFNWRDLIEHGQVSEKNFLKILPDTVDDFMAYVKMCVSLSITNGPSFAKVTDATNAASGIMIVDRVERFTLGQKCSIDDDNDSATNVYVTAINSNTNAVTLSASRGGAAANLSTYTVAQNAKFYFVGSQSNGMSSLKGALLPASAGGDSTLYGQTKTAYPFLQAIADDGSSITAANILESIFDHFVKVKNKGKGMPTKVLMSYKHFGSILKSLETSKGAFHVDPKGSSTSVYGWTEVSIFGPAGKLDVVAIQEMDDDWIAFLDVRPTVMKFYSNGFFRKQMGPDGNEYFESRDTTGRTYIVDISCFGDFVLQRPSYCGALYSISY